MVLQPLLHVHTGQHLDSDRTSHQLESCLQTVSHDPPYDNLELDGTKKRIREAILKWLAEWENWELAEFEAVRFAAVVGVLCGVFTSRVNFPILQEAVLPVAAPNDLGNITSRHRTALGENIERHSR